MKLIYKRILATVIDLAIVKILVDFLVANEVLNGKLFELNVFNKEVIFNYSHGWILLIGYFFIFDLLNQGQTIGKVIFGISLTTKDLRPNQWHFVLRSFYKFISLSLFPIALFLYLTKDHFILHEYKSNIVVSAAVE